MFVILQGIITYSSHISHISVGTDYQLLIITAMNVSSTMDSYGVLFWRSRCHLTSNSLAEVQPLPMHQCLIMTNKYLCSIAKPIRMTGTL